MGDDETMESRHLLAYRSEVQLWTADRQRLMMILHISHVASAQEPTTPTLMHVFSPHEQRACSGEYELASSLRPNGQPLWAQRNGKRWLYSGTNGRWYIGGPCAKVLDFKCSTGQMYNPEVHRGRLPH